MYVSYTYLEDRDVKVCFNRDKDTYLEIYMEFIKLWPPCERPYLCVAYNNFPFMHMERDFQSILELIVLTMGPKCPPAINHEAFKMWKRIYDVITPEFLMDNVRKYIEDYKRPNCRRDIDRINYIIDITTYMLVIAVDKGWIDVIHFCVRHKARGWRAAFDKAKKDRNLEIMFLCATYGGFAMKYI